MGSPTQNQRIERLWRDVFRAVTHMFYHTFQSMEEAGILDRKNDLHLFVLHFIFLPRINRAIEIFNSTAWNQHPIRKERNLTPMRIWTNGIDQRNRDLNVVVDVTESAISNDNVNLQWYGYDPQAKLIAKRIFECFEKGKK